jgi:type III pantothenate kinase
MPDILLVDMGNTRLKWVSAQGDQIIESSLGRGSAEEFLQAMRENPERPGNLFLSSVASNHSTREFMASCENKLGLSVRRLASQQAFAGIETGYRDPSALGVDRWLAIIGAAHFHGMPVIVMDLGTATTLDAVDQKGKHLGGLILPGPALMLESLSNGTAMQVPSHLKSSAELSGQKRLPGVAPAHSTASAIQEGVFAAQIGALNQFTRHVSMKLDTEPKLVLTGGAAEGILGRLEISPIFDPWLVFRGMLHHRE